MRVLITGGTGFIGSHVANATRARGHEVTLLARRAAPAPTPLISHDLTRLDGFAERLSGFDAVIHCAAAMHGSEQEQRSATVDATRNLVSAMEAGRVRRLILVSSFAVYDYASLEVNSLLTEDTPIDSNGHVRGPYVAAKRDQEQIVTRSSLEWTVLRPGLVFGPGRTWFYHLGARLPAVWVTLAGSATLPLTHVENCAAAIASALDMSGSVNTSINVVDDALPSRAEYVQWLAEHESTRPRVRDVPWSVLNAASRGAWMITHGLLRDIVRPPGSLHPEVLAARCKPLRYDNSRAHRLLAWRPEVSVRDGVRAAFEDGNR